MTKSNSKRLLIFLIIFSVINLILITYFSYNIFWKSSEDTKNELTNIEKIENSVNDNDSLFIAFLDSLSIVNDSIANTFSGNKVSIIITGLDSRLGTRSCHADANHLLNIWLDSGKIEIISIPRGTYSEAGLSSSLKYDPNDTTLTTNLNYLANVRSCRGRDAYVKAVSKISEVPQIDYFVEFGFSQAIGLLELLGFKENSVQTLRTLRSRKSFNVGDYQRSYNQGQFIRQMILKNFYRFDGLLGKALLKAGLVLVETNISFEEASNIINILKSKEFPRNPNDVIVRLKPKFTSDIKYFDFCEINSLDSLYKKIVRSASDTSVFDKKSYNTNYISKKVEKKLNLLIAKSASDTLKNPSRALKNLKIPFEQRAWYQVTDPIIRKKIRTDMCNIMYVAAVKIKDYVLAQKVKQIMEAEVVIEKINEKK